MNPKHWPRTKICLKLWMDQSKISRYTSLYFDFVNAFHNSANTDQREWNNSSKAIIY